MAYFAGFVAGRTEAWKARPRAPARGQSIAFDLTAGEAADCKSYDTLIDLSERAPGALVADKAYDSDAIRDDLKQRGIRAVIPPR